MGGFLSLPLLGPVEDVSLEEVLERKQGRLLLAFLLNLTGSIGRFGPSLDETRTERPVFSFYPPE